MKKAELKILSMVCISILSLSFQLQPPKEDYNICWSENLRLKWDDFQGPPDTTLNVNAQTATNVRTSGYGNSEVPNFRVSNIFIKSKSWSSDTTSSLLLQHEQLHFDISELCARRIREGIDEMRRKKVVERDRYTKLIDEKLKEMDKLNAEYDRKTFNGSIDLLQKEWNKRIKNELNLLRKYATRVEDCVANNE